MRSAALIAACLVTVAPAASGHPPKTKFADLDWLAGRWTGEALGGIAEASWSAPAGGQMVGHFSLMKGGKPAFYELMLLDETAAGVRLRVKHFNPDFAGWEEKNAWHTFEPVSAKRGDLKFDGLSIRLEGESLVETDHSLHEDQPDSR